MSIEYSNLLRTGLATSLNILHLRPLIIVLLLPAFPEILELYPSFRVSSFYGKSITSYMYLTRDGREIAKMKQLTSSRHNLQSFLSK